MTPEYDLRAFDAHGTYSAAALDNLQTHHAYWSLCGDYAAQLADLQPGMTVLDAGTGVGTLALSASRRVGHNGRVIAIDFSTEMLALASQRGSQSGARNIQWTLGDMTTLPLPPERADAVLCVLSLFAVRDMARFVARLWKHLRPGGQLVVATYGPRLLQPVLDVFVDAVRRERPALTLLRPWGRISDAGRLRQVVTAAGVYRPAIVSTSVSVPLDEPEAWWAAARGMGLRRTITLLGHEAADLVRAATVSHIQSHRVTELQTDFIFAVARKTGDPQPATVEERRQPLWTAPRPAVG